MRVSSCFGDDKSDLLTKGCAPQAAKDADPASGLEARVIGVIQMLVRELMVKLITPATQRPCRKDDVESRPEWIDHGSRRGNGILAASLRHREGSGRRFQSDGGSPGRGYAMTACAKGAVAPLGYVLGGRFDLVEVIGAGGLNTVYRAIDRMGLWAREQDPEVAVKVVRPHPTMRRELVRLLHREARLLRDLVHRNLVRIYDSDYDGKFHYQVMELLKGRSLAQILADRRGQPLSPAVSFQIIRAVGQGLAHIHGLGIVHGDLKPGNIFVTSTGDIKLLDFGAVLMLDVLPQGDEATAVHNQIGLLTPVYASPEMLLGEPRTEGDDVYSLAVVAYLALTGRHPYAHREADNVAKDRMPMRPATISPRQWRVLASGLALNRRHRIQSVAEFVQGLSHPPWYYRVCGQRMRLS